MVTLCASLTTLSLADPAAAQVPPAAKPDAAADGVELRIVTDQAGVALYSKETRKVTLGNQVADSWSFVCTAPCDRRVDPRLTYRVMGDDIVPSVTFDLAPGSPPLTLGVTPARRSPRTLGEILAVSAGVSGFAGVLLLLLDVAEHEAADAVGGDSPSAQTKLQGRAATYGDLGAAFVGAGLALGVGAFFLLRSGTTDLTPITAGSQVGSKAPEVRLVPGGFAF
jgi:hypothetical protein